MLLELSKAEVTLNYGSTPGEVFFFFFLPQGHGEATGLYGSPGLCLAAAVDAPG